MAGGSMENQPKKVISFYLEDVTLEKLDAIAIAQRRNRSTQIAFLVDEAYRASFPQIVAPTPEPTQAQE
jgi:hypothetical protein